MAGWMLFFIFFSSPGVNAAGHAKHRHKAHTHGQGALNLAIDQSNLLLELKVPAEDLVGFEHEPKTPKEKTLLSQAKATLANSSDTFKLPPTAKCVFVSPVEVDAEFSKSGHSEFHATYKFLCSNPSALSEVTVTVFKTFNKIKKLVFQGVTAKGQVSGTITPDNNTLKLSN